MPSSPIFEFSSSKQQALLLVHIERLKEMSVCDIDDIKLQLDELTLEQFPLSIQKRRVGAYDQYFWRFKSNKGNNQQRRFVRLSHEDLEDFLETCPHDFLLQLKRIEEMLIKLNANMKLVASLSAIVSDYNQQMKALMMLQSSTGYGEYID